MPGQPPFSPRQIVAQQLLHLLVIHGYPWHVTTMGLAWPAILLLQLVSSIKQSKNGSLQIFAAWLRSKKQLPYPTCRHNRVTSSGKKIGADIKAVFHLRKSLGCARYGAQCWPHFLLVRQEDVRNFVCCPYLLADVRQPGYFGDQQQVTAPAVVDVCRFHVDDSQVAHCRIRYVTLPYIAWVILGLCKTDVFRHCLQTAFPDSRSELPLLLNCQRLKTPSKELGEITEFHPEKIKSPQNLG